MDGKDKELEVVKHVSGLNQIIKHREELIRVDLRVKLADGKPLAVKIRNVNPLTYYSLGRSIPIPGGKRDTEWTHDEEAEYYAWMRKLISKCLVSIRQAYREEIVDADGKKTGEMSEWEERWLPMTMVEKDPDRTKGELTIDDFDFHDNVRRCYFAVLADNDHGQEFEEVVGCPFRPERSRPNGVARKRIRKTPARNRPGKAHKAG